MAFILSSRIPRSPLMTSSSSSHVNNDRLLQHDDTTPPKKQRHIPNKKRNNKTTFNPRLGAMSPESLSEGSSGHSDDAGSEGESDEDEAEDADSPDVFSPSSIEKDQAQAGADAAAGDLRDTQEGLSSYDSDSDDAEQDEDNFDVNDDDDDYDGIDKMSATTDVTHTTDGQFEAEVEDEILAAGEDGIDWDDEWTYGYSTAAGGAYYIEPPHMNVHGTIFELAGFEFDTTEVPTRTPTPAPAEWNGGDTTTPPKLLHFYSAWTSDSTDSEQSEASDTPSRKTSMDTGETGLSQFNSHNGNETDEEEEFPPPPPVSSPIAVSSAKTPNKISSSPRSRLITSSTPKKVGLKKPVLGKIKLNPDKAVAYFVEGSNVMKFLTPKGSALKWVDMRRFDSDEEDSGPDSPTMIDLDAALGDGNTRTGAAISDTLNGVMFRQYHCEPDILYALQAASAPTNMAEFARVPFMNRGSRSFSAMLDRAFPFDDMGITLDEPILNTTEALDLIDFDGGVESMDSVETPLPPKEPQQQENALPLFAMSEDNVIEDVDMLAESVPSSPIVSGSPIINQKGKGKNIANRATRSSTPLDEEQFSAMEITSSSPLKKRAASRSVIDAGSISPASKRKRRGY